MYVILGPRGSRSRILCRALGLHTPSSVWQFHSTRYVQYVVPEFYCHLS